MPPTNGFLGYRFLFLLWSLGGVPVSPHTWRLQGVLNKLVSCEHYIVSQAVCGKHSQRNSLATFDPD